MSKIVNFTNQESSESTNVLEEYVEYLRTMADILRTGCRKFCCRIHRPGFFQIFLYTGRIE